MLGFADSPVDCINAMRSLSISAGQRNRPLWNPHQNEWALNSHPLAKGCLSNGSIVLECYVLAWMSQSDSNKYWPPWTPTKMMIHFFLLSKDLMYILFSGQAVGKPKTWYLRSSHHVKEEDQAALVPKIITGGDLLQWQLPCCWWQLAPATDNTPFTVRTRSLCCRARCRRTRERHATAKSSTSNVRLERKSRFNLCNMDDPFRQLKWEFFVKARPFL